MTAKKRMTEEELATLIDHELRQSYGYGDGKLEQERRRALYYFMAEAKEDLAPPAIEGRSKVVDTTVRNTVLGMEGPLLKTFYGSDNVFEFEETVAEDAPKAKLISEYVNHIFRRKNPGYLITQTWIREALLQKKGIIKVWWDESDIETSEEYFGQTVEQLTILLDDKEVEVVAQKSYEDEDAAEQRQSVMEDLARQMTTWQMQVSQGDQGAAQMMANATAQMQQFSAQPVPMLYDVTVKRVKTGGRICIENVPPEEFLISKRAKSIAEAPFCAHRFKRTVAQLESSGYTVPDDLGGDESGADMSMERTERDSYTNSDSMPYRDGMEADPSQRELWVTESYLQVDFDGTGVPEWRKVVKCGTHVFANDAFDAPPFVDLGSVPLSFQFYGTCPADIALEPQRIKTSLIRSGLDNQYLQSNGRYYAVKNRVNLDDLLNSRPGGVVRVDDPQAVGRLDQGAGDVAGTMAMVEWAESYAEEATGWTRQSQGGNGNQLQQTATQANIITNRADMRVEAISRYMAETGFQALGEMILKLVCKYQRKAEMIKVGGEWVNIDPREWTNKFSLSINVGLGTGNKDQLVNHLNLLGMKTVEALQIGYATPKNLFNVSTRLSNALGFKNGDEFFTDPEKMPPKPPVEDPAVVKAKLDAEARQSELAFEREKAQMLAQVELQVAQTKAQAQMQVDQNRQQLEAEQQAMKIQLQAEQAERDAQRSFEEMRMKLELEREKLALKKYEIDARADASIVAAGIAAEQKSAAQAAAEEQSAQDMSANGNA